MQLLSPEYDRFVVEDVYDILQKVSLSDAVKQLSDRYQIIIVLAK